MLSLKLSVLSSVALLGATLAPSLHADQWNKKTVLTIKETIQLPHAVLQPGTYVFKLADSPSDRHIVLAWGRDYGDVSPVHGVILGGGDHSLQVKVDVTRLDHHQ